MVRYSIPRRLSSSHMNRCVVLGLIALGLVITGTGCPQTPSGATNGCGEIGMMCCPSSGNQEECLRSGLICERSTCCGRLGGPSCSDKTDCCAGFDCQGGACCVPEGGACRSNAECCGSNSRCDSTTGLCTDNGPCVGIGCNNDTTGDTCNTEGAKCCAGDVCGSSGSTLLGCMGGTCRTCGTEGAPCCPTATGCSSGLDCFSGVCQRQGGSPSCTATTCLGCDIDGCGWCNGKCVPGDSFGSTDGACSRGAGNWISAFDVDERECRGR